MEAFENKELLEQLIIINKLIEENISNENELSENYWTRGLIFSRMENFEKASDDFECAIKLNPKVWEFYHSRGENNMNLERYDLAIVDANIGLSLNPSEDSLYYLRGTAKWRLKDFKGAIFDITRQLIVSGKPLSADAHYIIGYCKLHLKNYEGALSDLNNAILMNPNDAEALISRSVLNKCLGKSEEALNDYNCAFELDNNVEFDWGISNNNESFETKIKNKLENINIETQILFNSHLIDLLKQQGKDIINGKKNIMLFAKIIIRANDDLVLYPYAIDPNDDNCVNSISIQDTKGIKEIRNEISFLENVYKNSPHDMLIDDKFEPIIFDSIRWQTEILFGGSYKNKEL